MSTKTLMVQGTTSDAGKSTLVAALCRILARQHFKVAPFKPQNMALNSAVTACGGEIGRAQAVQAIAANIEAEVDFNPILLKPNSDTGAQVIVHGKAITDMEASAYHDYKKVAMDAVLQSHERLEKRFEYIIVEGAGSPAEINLRAGDIANMGFAEAVDCPVILIADIDRGGVFAHLVGTLALLSESEQNRVVGFVINRFRGDIALLQSGLDWLEQRTNKPVLGVLPYLHGLTIAAEDAVDTTQNVNERDIKSQLKVIVPIYPRMSNHSDFDPLRWHPDIDLTFVYPDESASKSLPEADFIILPGSKNVRADLAFLKKQGWHHDIAKHLRYGGKLWGICGGYQMLGKTIADPSGVEGEVGISQALGYFPFDTELKQSKTLKNITGTLSLNDQITEVSGYEIHAGQSVLSADADEKNILKLEYELKHEMSGLVSNDNQIAGGYLHGLFDQPAALQLIIKWCGFDVAQPMSMHQQQSNAIDKLADACQQHLDMKQLNNILTTWESNHD